MAEHLLDPSWYRAADIKPRLRPHVQIHGHRYRGQRWYVVQDGATGRFHRFSPVAHRIIGMMNGERTLNAIWERALDALGDDAPTQSEVLQLVHQLHAADVLQTDVPADSEERVRRFDKERRSRLWQQLASPMSLRVPLVDPERLLAATQWLVRPFLSWFGLVLWLAVVGTAAVQAAMHWPELAADVSGRLLAPQNLLLIWVTFPVVKLFHELGHAYAVKHWGGEVHQMGVMFLVLTPIPYVDATAATAFRSKLQRAFVGAAGMLVEVFLAALALFVWLAVEPGTVKAVAYNVMVIAGLSTLIFNGNPLLRFDAYYILADLIEIPNLASRANRWVYYQIQSRLFGLDKAANPVQAPGEALWFAFYAPAAFVYRLTVYIGISIFIAQRLFFVGVLLALWSVAGMLVFPAVKALRWLATDPALGERRLRAWSVSGGLLAALLALVFLVPVPLATIGEGVLWTPEGAQVRAGASGFVKSIEVEPGSRVAAGQAVLLLDNPLLRPELKVLEGELAALEARYDLVRREDRVRTEIVLEQIAAVAARIARKREQIAELRVAAPVAGRLVLPRAHDLPHRYVHQGEQLGHVIEDRPPTVRAVVTQDEVDLVRNRTRAVAVRRADRIGERFPAHIAREVPSASLRLPSVALGTGGGGRIPIDPRDPQAETALEKVFQFDVIVERPIGAEISGSRVYVRFDHGFEPIGFAWYRTLRRLFLRQLDV